MYKLSKAHSCFFVLYLHSLDLVMKGRFQWQAACGRMELIKQLLIKRALLSINHNKKYHFAADGLEFPPCKLQDLPLSLSHFIVYTTPVQHTSTIALNFWYRCFFSFRTFQYRKTSTCFVFSSGQSLLGFAHVHACADRCVYHDQPVYVQNNRTLYAQIPADITSPISVAHQLLNWQWLVWVFF